jgi:hypothetical protein
MFPQPATLLFFVTGSDAQSRAEWQNEAGIKDACDDARAEPAYGAQDKWPRTHGLMLKQELQADMLALDAVATCM